MLLVSGLTYFLYYSIYLEFSHHAQFWRFCLKLVYPNNILLLDKFSLFPATEICLWRSEEAVWTT